MTSDSLVGTVGDVLTNVALRHVRTVNADRSRPDITMEHMGGRVTRLFSAARISGRDLQGGLLRNVDGQCRSVIGAPCTAEGVRTRLINSGSARNIREVGGAVDRVVLCASLAMKVVLLGKRFVKGRRAGNAATSNWDAGNHGDREASSLDSKGDGRRVPDGANDDLLPDVRRTEKATRRL